MGILGKEKKEIHGALNAAKLALGLLFMGVSLGLGGCGDRAGELPISRKGGPYAQALQVYSPKQPGRETLKAKEAGRKKSLLDKTCRYLEEENARGNPLFALFLDYGTTAYDPSDGRDKYLYEYLRENVTLSRVSEEEYDRDALWEFFGEHTHIDGVRIMAKDLNGDGQDELLVYVDRGAGDLLVFEETGGEIHTWELWKNFSSNWLPEVSYYGNGFFAQKGGEATIVSHYEEERVETLFCLYRGREEFNPRDKDRLIKKETLYLYEGGELIKEFEYEGIFCRKDDSLEMTPENQAAMEELNTAIDEWWKHNKLKTGGGDLIYGLRHDESAKEMFRWELLNIPRPIRHKAP